MADNDVELCVQENGKIRLISSVVGSSTVDGLSWPLSSLLKDGKLIVASFLRELLPKGPAVCLLTPTGGNPDAEFSRFVAYLHSGVSGTSGPKSARLQTLHENETFVIVPPTSRESDTLTVIRGLADFHSREVSHQAVAENRTVPARRAFTLETSSSSSLPFPDDSPSLSLPIPDDIPSLSFPIPEDISSLSLPIPEVEDVPVLPTILESDVFTAMPPSQKKEDTHAAIVTSASIQPSATPHLSLKVHSAQAFIPGKGVEYIPQADLSKLPHSSLVTALVSRIVSGEIPFPFRRSYVEEKSVCEAFSELREFDGLGRLVVEPNGFELHGYFPFGSEITHYVDGPIRQDINGKVLGNPPFLLSMQTAYPTGAPSSLVSAGGLFPLSPLLFFAGNVPAYFPWDGSHSEKFAILIDYFTESARMAAVKKNEGSAPLHLWRTPSVAEAIAKKALGKYRSATSQSLRLGMYGSLAGCNLFKPQLAKTVFQAMGSKRVLDMCAGWGCRLMGAMGTPGILRYVAFDPNSALIPGHTEMIEKFSRLGGGEYIVHPLPFEVGIASCLTEEDVRLGFDTAFTSPPYFDLEVYEQSDDGGGKKVGQSIETHGAGDLGAWLETWYFPMMQSAWKHLNVGGHLVIYINDHMGLGSSSVIPSVPGGAQLDTEFLAICHPMLRYAATQLADCRWVGVLGLQGEGFKGSTGKFRPLWVWRKGDLIDDPPRVFAPPIYRTILEKSGAYLAKVQRELLQQAILQAAMPLLPQRHLDGVGSRAAAENGSVAISPSSSLTPSTLPIYNESAKRGPGAPFTFIPRKRPRGEEDTAAAQPTSVGTSSSINSGGFPPPKEPAFSQLFEAIRKNASLHLVVGILGVAPPVSLQGASSSPPSSTPTPGTIPWINDDSSSLAAPIDRQPITPLGLASKLGRLAILTLLCDTYGADPNVQASKSGYTPLGLAVHENHHHVIEALLARGGDPNVSNKWGETALSAGEKKWGRAPTGSMEARSLALLRSARGGGRHPLGGDGQSSSVGGGPWRDPGCVIGYDDINGNNNSVNFRVRDARKSLRAFISSPRPLPPPPSFLPTSK